MRESKNKKEIAGKRVGVREGGVGTKELGGEEVYFSNEGSGEIKVAFT